MNLPQIDCTSNCRRYHWCSSVDTHYFTLYLEALPSKNIFISVSLLFLLTHFFLFSYFFSVFDSLFLSLCSLFLYLHCFSDISQLTLPPFHPFLLALHLPLLFLLVIFLHLVLERGSIKEGENRALAFCSAHVVSLFSAFLICHVLLSFSMLIRKALFRQRDAESVTHWLIVWEFIQAVFIQKWKPSNKNKAISVFDINGFRVYFECGSLCEQGQCFSFFKSVFCYLSHFHLSTAVPWLVCVLVSTPPPLSLIFWNFNFWPPYMRMNLLSQRAGTHLYTK